MTILEKIVAHKRTEVAQRKELYHTKLLERSIHFNAQCVSLRKYLLRDDLFGIIAEIKRKSPTKGNINKYVNVERTSIGYMMAGASALSILTDTTFFDGKSEDLTMARKFNFCPILRKDFIVDEYQIIEAKSIGADAILLLANVLSADEIKRFSALAKSLGMESLLEVHDAAGLNALAEQVDLVGVNNRNLDDFSVSIDNSLKVLGAIPKSMVCISESGLENPEDVLRLKAAGFNGFLIGEHFMKHGRPEVACTDFIQQLKQLTAQGTWTIN